MSYLIANDEAVKNLSFQRTTPVTLAVVISTNFPPQGRYFSIIFHVRLKELSFRFDTNLGRGNPHPLVDTWFDALTRKARVLNLSSLCLYAYIPFLTQYPLNNSFSQVLLTKTLGRRVRWLKFHGLVLRQKLCGLLGRAPPFLV